MSNFNEANTNDAYIRDQLCGGVTKYTASGPRLARTAGKMLGLGWNYVGPGYLLHKSHGWQKNNAGEREVKKALRKTLFKYRLY